MTFMIFLEKRFNLWSILISSKSIHILKWWTWGDLNPQSLTGNASLAHSVCQFQHKSNGGVEGNRTPVFNKIKKQFIYRLVIFFFCYMQSIPISSFCRVYGISEPRHQRLPQSSCLFYQVSNILSPTEQSLIFRHYSQLSDIIVFMCHFN